MRLPFSRGYFSLDRAMGMADSHPAAHLSELYQWALGEEQEISQASRQAVEGLPHLGWSVYFVIFQIMASDLVRFAQFITGREQLAGLLRIVWTEVPLWLYAPYLFGMIIMWVTYGLILFTDFTRFAVQVKRDN